MGIINDNIKKARSNANMTLEELAVKVGVSRQTVQKYESGVISNIPSDKIEKLADALAVSPAYLMGWEDEEMISTLTKAAEDAVLNAQISKDEDLKRMIKMYNALPEDKKKTIRQIVEDYYNTFV